MTKLIRITTVPISLKYLITGQMRYMREQGFDVVMMSADGPEVDEVVQREGCPHEVVPLTRKITPLADLKALWILYRKLRKHRPDIVHSHTPKAGLIGMLAAWLARVPIRLHTVAGLPLETATGAKRLLLLWIEWLTYLCATEVWPNSRSLATFIEQHHLAPSKKIHMIGRGSSNGIDTSEFSRDHLDSDILEQVKETINYQSDKRYLLFVGRVVRDKGIEELVEAFVALTKEIEDLVLVLVGPYEKALDPLSDETMTTIETRADIIATGFSDKVKYYMALADLFVFPSHREGFPNVPMQAALMGLPVVASRITGNVDIVEDGVNGVLVEKGNVKDLTRGLRYALTTPDDMQALASALHKHVVTHYDRSIVQGVIKDRYRWHLEMYKC